MRPMIGISGMRHTHASKLPGPLLRGVALGDDYAHGVEQAGGIPLVIPYFEVESTVEALADRLDGLLLSGGEDIDPNLFGEEPRLGLGEITPERDSLEIALLRAMHARRKPVLGICRGMQLMNAAFGGSLYQDLPREWNGAIQHSQRAPRSHMSHRVHIEPGSRLYDLLDAQAQVQSNTFHHQAVKAVAPNFVPVAWDEEGLVEGIEHPGDLFLVAVQWHPENLWRGTPVYRGLFQGLVEAALEAAQAPVHACDE